MNEYIEKILTDDEYGKALPLAETLRATLSNFPGTTVEMAKAALVYLLADCIAMEARRNYTGPEDQDAVARIGVQAVPGELVRLVFGHHLQYPGLPLFDHFDFEGYFVWGKGEEEAAA